MRLYGNELDNLDEMNRFLETYNLLRLNHVKIENLDKLLVRLNQ